MHTSRYPIFPFFSYPKCPTPILGKTFSQNSKPLLLSQTHLLICSLATAPQPQLLFPTPLLSPINAIVWDTDNPSVTSHHVAVHIRLKKAPNPPINHSTQSPKNIKGKSLSPLNSYVRASCAQATSYNTLYSTHQSQMAPINCSGPETYQCSFIPLHPIAPKSLYSFPLIPSSTAHFTVLHQGCLLYHSFATKLSRPLCLYLY